MSIIQYLVGGWFGIAHNTEYGRLFNGNAFHSFIHFHRK